MFALYNILLYIFAVFFFPYMAIKLMIKGKSRAGMRQRFGYYDRTFTAGPKSVWIHAVSVGETLAAVPVVVALKEKNPGLLIRFSTVTETGNAVAREKLGDMAEIFYFPFDFGFSVKKAVDAVRPDVFVVVETELWPNLLKLLYDRGIPSVMINGRISARSFKGYYRARFFMRRVLAVLSYFNMQTAQDAERITRMGAPGELVQVAGNIKFDQACGLDKDGGAEAFTRARLGLPDTAVVMVAGSTHDGEEVEALKAYSVIRAEYPDDAYMILAPRHPERLAVVETLLKSGGYEYILRSELNGSRLDRPQVILLNTMGELARIYRVADINFVGGSLVPVGGHNILEPAAFGKPVFFGPHMHNFHEISSILKQCGVGIQVSSGDELGKEAIRLLQEPKRLEKLASVARDTLLKNRGALGRNVELIERYLG